MMKKKGIAGFSVSEKKVLKPVTGESVNLITTHPLYSTNLLETRTSFDNIYETPNYHFPMVD